MTTVTAGICARPLGQILVERGWLSADQLSEALAEQNRSGGRLGQVLVRLKLLDEVQLAEALSEQGKLPTMQLRPGMVDVNVAQRLGAEHSWNWKAIAVNEVAGVVTVAMEDPGDEQTVNALAKHLDSAVFAVHAGPKAVRACLDHFFPKGFGKTLDLKEVLRNATPDEAVLRGRLRERNEPPADESEPAIQLVRSILEDALASRASDVHVEPRLEDAVVRFRIDGQLHDRLTLPSYWLRPLLTRLKVMADLDIAQRRLPQDGRLQFEMQDQRIDLRLATSPGLRGEGAVIRILHGGRRVFAMDRIGLTPDQLATLRRIAMARDGFILCTGPTGAGKTSTAYSVLNELNTPDRKLITLEDPVENELPEAFPDPRSKEAGPRLPDGSALGPALGSGRHLRRRGARIWRLRASRCRQRSPVISCSARSPPSARPKHSAASKTWESSASFSPTPSAALFRSGSFGGSVPTVASPHGRSDG